MNKIICVVLGIGIMLGLPGCKNNKKEVCHHEKERVSGPLADPDVCWSKEDYR